MYVYKVILPIVAQEFYLCLISGGDELLASILRDNALGKKESLRKAL